MTLTIFRMTKPTRPHKSLTTLAALSNHNLIENPQPLEPIAQSFQIAITPTMFSAITDKIPNDPIMAQFIPQLAEAIIQPEEIQDPIGDHTHSPVKGLVHRYPDRVLLKVTNACAVYCRFCFRREMLGAKGEAFGQNELNQSIDYIKQNKNIWEVILTGGDPLILSPRRLNDIITRLLEIPHIMNIRIHTRVPVVEPHAITQELAHILAQPFSQYKSLVVVIHANHAQEFTPESYQALHLLRQQGIPLRSQSVLLKGVNDNVLALTQLMRKFIEYGVQPYYLHQLDYAKGTSHFRVEREKAIALIRQLRQHVSGLCVPTLIEEIPGGAGKSVLY